jgi:hypothetical protein
MANTKILNIKHILMLIHHLFNLNNTHHPTLNHRHPHHSHPTPSHNNPHAPSRVSPLQISNNVNRPSPLEVMLKE